MTLGEPVQLAVDFVPSQTHQRVKVSGTITKDGRDTLVFDEIRRGVEANKMHTLNGSFTPIPEFGTGPTQLRVEVRSDGIVEVCGIIPAVFVSA